MMIYDNFLTDEEFFELKKVFYGHGEFASMIPWYYSDSKAYKDSDKNICTTAMNNFQFTHHFYVNHNAASEYFYLIQPMIDFFDPISILRIRANLTVASDNNTEHFGLHTDAGVLEDKDIGYTTAIFYVNSNNGKTLFEDGTEVLSVENRLLVFDGKLKHTATTHSDTKTRCVINFNYIG